VVQTRNSQQRILIENIMRDNYDHPTADEVYEKAREQDSHISRGTVYRNLNLLAKRGDVRRLTMPDNPDHYDGRTDNHYHFLCRRCGRVFDTPISYNETYNDISKSMPGFETERHRLLFIGLCPDCAEKETKEK